MKAILFKNIITLLFLMLGSHLIAQSLLPPGPIVIAMACEGDTITVKNYDLTTQLDTFARNNFTILTYQWVGPPDTQPGNGNTYTATETGAYVLTVNALRLRDSVRVNLSDTIRVVFDAQCCKLKMPNAFTPDGDDKNDIFRPVLPDHCVFQNYQLQVFNRWGKKVFDTNLVNTPFTPNTVLGWDGKIDGKEAPSDVYVYWVRYTTTGNNNTYPGSTFKGDVTLIR